VAFKQGKKMLNSTETIDRKEAAKILDVKLSSFTYFVARYDNFLKPARKEGNIVHYRKCDVEAFKQHMKENPKPRHATTKLPSEIKVSGTIASRIVTDSLKLKKALEDEIYKLQEFHLDLCKRIKVLSK
jgi:hypothetical protein